MDEFLNTTKQTKQGVSEGKEQLKKKILLAEDDHNTRFLLVRMLKREGYEIDEVEDGQFLVDALFKGDKKYDLVITDHNMPRVDGIDALEIIRADDRFKDLPVIVHSGVADEMAERIKSLNGNGIKKGIIDNQDLLKKILEILTQPKE